jgi:hypothetical protein
MRELLASPSMVRLRHSADGFRDGFRDGFAYLNGLRVIVANHVFCSPASGESRWSRCLPRYPSNPLPSTVPKLADNSPGQLIHDSFASLKCIGKDLLSVLLAPDASRLRRNNADCCIGVRPEPCGVEGRQSLLGPYQWLMSTTLRSAFGKVSVPAMADFPSEVGAKFGRSALWRASATADSGSFCCNLGCDGSSGNAKRLAAASK